MVKNAHNNNFDSNCVFRDTIFHNYNHVYNLARYDYVNYNVGPKVIEIAPEPVVVIPKAPPRPVV